MLNKTALMMLESLRSESTLVFRLILADIHKRLDPSGDYWPEFTTGRAPSFENG